MNNDYIAQILREVHALLQIAGENRFKIRAFDIAARAIEGLHEPASKYLERGDLTSIEGVGASIAKDIEQILQTGSCQARDELLQKLNPGLLDLIKIQGLGPKRIKTLYDTLGVGDLDALRAAATEQKIRAISGFGKKTEENILIEIERMEKLAGRTPLPTALALAQHLRQHMLKVPGVRRVEIAGSIRRGKETIGDIDLLVLAQDHHAVMQAASTLPGTIDILAHGEKKTSILLAQGIQVDVRVVEDEVFGSALHYFTGSKEHHVKLRTRAKRQGLKISEYGVFKIDDETTPIASATEEDLYQALGLPFIPPELREGLNEIDAAEQDSLPKLITLDDIMGDIHMHTTASDGDATILEMAQAAKARGYRFIVITDHSQVLTVANGLSPDRFAAHIEAIKEADAQIEDFTILSGIEVDILKDGSLDMDHELLKSCDWVVGSVHTAMNQTRELMTERLLQAIDTGLLSCLGHPTGRILGGRSGYEYDMETILIACRDKRVAVEINGSTGRLDFNAEHAAFAASLGVKIVLGSDAHSTMGLDAMRFAVQQARRAWLTPQQVLNTFKIQDLLSSVRDTGSL